MSTINRTMRPGGIPVQAKPASSGGLFSNWSISRKIAFAIAVPIVIGLGAVIALSASAMRTSMLELSKRSETQVTEMMAAQMSAAVRFKNADAIGDSYADLATAKGTSLAGVRVVDGDAEPLIDYPSKEKPLPAGMPAFDFASANLAKTVTDVKVLDLGSFLVVQAPVRAGVNREQVGTLTVAWSRANVQASISEAVLGNVLIALVVLAVLIGILVVLLHKIVGSPLKNMQSAMSKLAAGDLSVQITGTERGDEIGAMAQSVQVFKDNALEVDNLRRRQEEAERAAAEEKKAAMQKLASDFESSVKGVVAELSGASSQVQSPPKVSLPRRRKAARRPAPWRLPPSRPAPMCSRSQAPRKNWPDRWLRSAIRSIPRPGSPAMRPRRLKRPMALCSRWPSVPSRLAMSSS